jgi:hypothetical protein
MFRTVIVREYGTFVGKRGERLLLRGPVKARPPAAEAKAADLYPPTKRRFPFSASARSSCRRVG